MKELLQETKEIKQHLIQYNFHMKMDTVDISEYFPLKSDGDIRTFMNNDEEWNSRKKESNNLHFRYRHTCLIIFLNYNLQAFYQVLFNLRTKVGNKFAPALLHMVFSREFIRNHKWPAAG